MKECGALGYQCQSNSRYRTHKFCVFSSMSNKPDEETKETDPEEEIEGVPRLLVTSVERDRERADNRYPSKHIDTKPRNWFCFNGVRRKKGRRPQPCLVSPHKKIKNLTI